MLWNSCLSFQEWKERTLTKVPYIFVRDVTKRCLLLNKCCGQCSCEDWHQDDTHGDPDDAKTSSWRWTWCFVSIAYNENSYKSHCKTNLQRLHFSQTVITVQVKHFKYCVSHVKILYVAYPTVVIVTKAHQIPSPNPFRKDLGNSSGLYTRSWNNEF